MCEVINPALTRGTDLLIGQLNNVIRQEIIGGGDLKSSIRFKAPKARIEQEFLDAKGAAKYLGISVALLYELSGQGIVTRFVIKRAKKRELVRYRISQLNGIFVKDKSYVVKELPQYAQGAANVQ